MTHRRLPSTGQGLLEVIISVGVIIAGTVGTVTLVTSTIKAGRTTNDQVVAANLAREAVEAVRSTRDSNWLKTQANVINSGTGRIYGAFDGIYDPASPEIDHTHDENEYAIPIFTAATNDLKLKPLSLHEFYAPDVPGGCTDGAFAWWNCLRVFKDSGSGGFGQRFDTAVPGQPTKFTRWLALSPICRADQAPQDGIADSGATDAFGTSCDFVSIPADVLVGVKATAVVSWAEGGTPKSYVLEDRFYNWKYVK